MKRSPVDEKVEGDPKLLFFKFLFCSEWITLGVYDKNVYKEVFANAELVFWLLDDLLSWLKSLSFTFIINPFPSLICYWIPPENFIDVVNEEEEEDYPLFCKILMWEVLELTVVFGRISDYLIETMLRFEGTEWEVTFFSSKEDESRELLCRIGWGVKIKFYLLRAA